MAGCPKNFEKLIPDVQPVLLRKEARHQRVTHQQVPRHCQDQQPKKTTSIRFRKCIPCVSPREDHQQDALHEHQQLFVRFLVVTKPRKYKLKDSIAGVSAAQSCRASASPSPSLCAQERTDDEATLHTQPVSTATSTRTPSRTSPVLVVFCLRPRSRPATLVSRLSCGKAPEEW